jgi:hypothetical protein
MGQGKALFFISLVPVLSGGFIGYFLSLSALLSLRNFPVGETSISMFLPR